MNGMRLTVLALAFTFLSLGFADQIENEAAELANAPQGVLVKVNPETKTIEIFQAPVVDEKVLNKSASNTEMENTIRNTENSLNKIGEYQLATKELDKESSTEAWYTRWYGYNWRWNNWGGYYRPYYYNWYRPYYSGYFNYGYRYYNYGYYYPYNNCYYGWYY